jgi:hypothetical protein
MQNRKDIKIIQISSEPNSVREISSFDSLSQLGYRYVRIINPRYKEYPPTENVFDGRKDWVVGITKPDPDQFGLTSGHYGAWQGHISAILSSFVDTDYSLICECDCLLNVNPESFKKYVDEAIITLENSDYKIVRFEAANLNQVNYGERITENLYLADIMTLGHCYLINTKHRNWWLERIDSIGWHTPDWWLNFAFLRADQKMLSFKELVLTKQSEGFSLVDNTHRSEKIRF